MAVSGTQVFFKDDFSTSGSLNGTNWDYNHAYYGNDAGNPAFLGNTLQRQELPTAENGMARLKLDTWNFDWKDGRSFYGSEAISKGAWDAKSTGGVAFEATMRFEGTQGGMIGGMFFYQQFPPPPSPRIPHNELDWEILTSQLRPSSVNKISTNVFPHEATESGEADHPKSYPVTEIPGFSPNDFHTYRIEWLPKTVTWLIDNKIIRTEKVNVPQAGVKQQLHLNLWGVPTSWGPSPGDPKGPNIGDPTFVPATSADANRSYYLDVTSVKVEKLSTWRGTSAADALAGGALNDAIEGGGGNDSLDGRSGDDTISGGSGDDRLSGGLGNDRLEGGTGNDELKGGKGGADVMIGGNGNDTYFVDDLSDVIVETGSGYDRISTSVSFSLTAGQGIDFLSGRGQADLTLIGNQLANSIWGSAGDDTIAGGAGYDILRGKGGADTLVGGAHDDILEGGDGADRFNYGLGDGNDSFTDFSGAGGDRVALSNVTLSQLVNNIATLSDGSILTAQTGYVWAASDFMTV